MVRIKKILQTEHLSNCWTTNFKTSINKIKIISIKIISVIVKFSHSDFFSKGLKIDLTVYILKLGSEKRKFFLHFTILNAL